MRVPIYKRLMEARDNPNADLHKLTTDILALFSVVGQREQFICYKQDFEDKPKCSSQCRKCGEYECRSK